MASRKVAWKKIHAHVFRPPEKSILLALMLGAGIHALCMACLTVLLEFFYGQQNLAGLFIVTFPYFGVFNGYVSAKFYAYFNGSSWIALTLMSTILYPFVLFGCYFYIDWVDPAYAAKLYGQEGVSLNTFSYLWLFVCLPGSIFGAYNGFMTERIQIPTKQSRLRRDIPQKSRISQF